MEEYKIFFLIVSVSLGLLGYVLYMRSVLRGETRPHPFSWLLFVIVDFTVFAAQILNGGGMGAWIVGIGGAFNTTILFLAFTKGEKRIVLLDWICLFLAATGIVLWWFTSSALTAVVLAATADAIAKIPTMRKAYVRPGEESITIWGLDVFRFGLSLLAFESLTLTTGLSPVAAGTTNAIVVALILLRRRQLGTVPQTNV